jgi:hypothetical protein
MNLVTRSVHVAGVTTAANGTYMKQVVRKPTQVSDGFFSKKEFLIYILHCYVRWDRSDRR